MDNRNIKIICSFAVILISLSLVSALGVNSPYWKDNPLKMYPGETKYVEFNLENSVSEKEDAKAIVELLDSQNIAEITSQKEFIIPPGSKENKIIIKISIPKGTEIGNTYNIKFSVRSPQNEKEGIVQINIGYDVEFPIIIVSQSEISNKSSKETASYKAIIVILLLAVILIIAYLIYRKNKFK